MSRLLTVLILCFFVPATLAEEPPAGEKAPAADQAAEKADLKAEDEAAHAREAEKEFKPPPGFKTKKRGKLVLYCMQDSTVGTRFKTEKCYDEAQLRDYLIAQAENKRDMDRVRSTCSSGLSGGPCVHP
jgi:hypothetical protein